MHVAQGDDAPQDAAKVGDYWRKNHAWHHNDMPSHVGQTRTELVRKTAKNVLGDLISYEEV